MVNASEKIKEAMNSPRFSTVWALLATVAATVSLTSFLSTHGGPGTSHTYELIISIMIGSIFAITHIPLIFAAQTIRNHPWVRTPEFDLLQVMVTCAITMFITMFLFKFPFVHVDKYTITSTLAFTMDVIFLKLCLAPKSNIMVGWYVLGCEAVLCMVLGVEFSTTTPPGYEAIYAVWYLANAHLSLKFVCATSGQLTSDCRKSDFGWYMYVVCQNVAIVVALLNITIISYGRLLSG